MIRFRIRRAKSYTCGMKKQVNFGHQHRIRQERMRLSTVGGPGPGWGGGVTTHVDRYDEGTLILDIIAPDGKTLLWRGTATAQIDESAKPKKREAKINEAVGRMLKRFPPK